MLVLLAGAQVAHGIATKHAPGCKSYLPVANRYLIAHASGGLPDRMYPNSIAALDRSYAHGLRTFELDFHQLPFGLMRSGHDLSDLFDPRGAWLQDVLAWMRRHPDARLLVDMKTNNLEGLKRIAAAAPDLRSRIIPFVYHRDEYDAVRALDLHLPVALLRGEDSDWLNYTNTLAFAAAALSREQLIQAPRSRHPVVAYTLDTLDDTQGADAIITNCMYPVGERHPGRQIPLGL